MSEIAKAFPLPSVSKSSVISGWKVLDICELINLSKPNSSVIKKFSLISCAPLCGISNFPHFLVQLQGQYFSRIRPQNILRIYSEFFLVFAMPNIRGLCNQWQDCKRHQWAYSIVIRYAWDLEILILILSKVYGKKNHSQMFLMRFQCFTNTAKQCVFLPFSSYAHFIHSCSTFCKQSWYWGLKVTTKNPDTSLTRLQKQ